ncbi:cellulose biosynthesis protein BcsF [Enterobacteriaceae bacterium YMB-R22]|jgi:cellulose biosynthesis operon protein BcsF/YhjT|uniref:cellulose biosynthesis protein BcsF n=1 Tax=Tenebrionicola larvae TaxID=2815733 RepID=UPI0020122B05|nr:cellulose biosynthesis protein BcsF [Tenebrionicola larvae]MBV4414480.1 cellulose biosynthesis protein BcsF [Tenebrionicola larvae]
MNITDILQLVLLCAALFIPLGYMGSRWLARLKRRIRITLMKPRSIKPAGTLRRQHSAKAYPEHD